MAKLNSGNMVMSLEDIENEGLREFATGIVEEAAQLGLDFCGYGYTLAGEDEPSGGVHLFQYRWPRDTEPTDEEWEALRAFLVRNDDSQPYSQFSWFFGDVWHFVPYYC